jgi:hypothetical protein
MKAYQYRDCFELVYLHCEKCRTRFCAMVYPRWEPRDVVREFRSAHVRFSPQCATKFGADFVRVVTEGRKSA